ncbi:MAG: DUF1080 domain-containing protein, partial [Planctomycetota bacterium]|nr:DUF1080 domain-containing protein [Planctomycetota bacterium]
MRISSLGNSVFVLALCLIAGGCAGTRTASGIGSIMPSADLHGWVGGSTFDPDRLAAMGESERAEKLAAWTDHLAGHWWLEGDELVSDGHGPHLVTARDYGDFELHLEWKLQPNGDSGVYLR